MVATFGRGSEWRRWDLHIHTPDTALNNQFTSWESYLELIESANSSIAVIGVTDYCTLRSYKKILTYREQGRLQNIALTIPNIEFRITPETRDGKGINLHLLISPHEPDHVSKMETLLARLAITRNQERISCIEPDLRRLGEMTKPHLVTSPDAAFREGVNQFKVGFDTFQEWWSREPWLVQHTLIAVANSSSDGPSGLRDGGFQSTREEIYRFAHIIFSGKPNDRTFFLGQSPSGWGHNKKPCLHGSDAHENTKLFHPNLDRFCWIKADPTFDGLRQTLYEPEDRVFIGPTPPTYFDPGSVISAITFSRTEGWFEERTIPINSGLVAIVGLKGSGKTALADMIAFTAGAETDPDDSFIARARDELKGMQVELTWASGRKDTAYPPFYAEVEAEAKVRYLSQKFVERLCTGDHLRNDLLDEVEGVVFSHIPFDERLGAADFGELKAIRTEYLRSRRNDIRKLISQTSREITELDKRKNDVNAKKKRRTELEQTIQRLRQSRPTISDQAAAQHMAEFHKAREGHELIANRIAQLRRSKVVLEEVRKQINAWYNEIEFAWSAKQSSLVVAGLTSDEINRLKPIVLSDWGAPFSTRSTLLQAQIDDLGGDQTTLTDTHDVPSTLAQWKHRVQQLSNELRIDETNKQRILALMKEEDRSSQELDKIDRDFEWLDQLYENERAQKFSEREQYYLEFFDLLKEEQIVLAELYEPLKTSLSSKGYHEKKLALFCRINVDTAAWVHRGEQLFDFRRRANPFKDKDLADLAKDHLERHWKNCSKEDIRTGLNFIIEQIKESDLVKDLLNSNYTPLDVADWLFSVDHLTISYGLRYDEKDLRLLSPGTKGIVLLILYLAIDTDDRRPLIVDQPDENLDNQSIFEILRHYFREAKRRRQVIVITHNPNLVVNTDAEQVIIAKCDMREGNWPKMSYSHGSLEAIQAEGHLIGSIRNEICTILEGGQEAFKMRERRYASSN
jgi:DNA repair ATPase RecN